MSFTTYILFSKKLNRYYIGQTEDLEKRLHAHSVAKNHFTSRADDFQIVFTQKFETRSDAIALESKIKKRGAARFLHDNSE